MNAIDGSTHVQTASLPPPSLLVIVLDTNPHAWEALSPTLPLSKALGVLQIFINAHLAFSSDNRVAVIAAHTDRAAWLYPTPNASTGVNEKKVTVSKGNISANKYLPFAAIERQLVTNLTALLSTTSPETLRASQQSNNYTTHLAGALTLALSYINKTTLLISTDSSNTAASIPSAADAAAQQARAPVNSRILVLSTSGDLAGQYIPLMNLIFGAQHSRVLIDILKLAGDSVLLQQASFTTSGIFVAPAHPPAQSSTAENDPQPRPSPGPPTPTTLLQYLMQAFLPDPHARQLLLPPTSPHVDFRAACFCHQRVVDVGYVCSICLSIFCEDLRKDLGLETWDSKDGTGIECLTCGTKLVLSEGGGVAAGGAKKEKKKDKDKKKKDKDRPKG